MPENGIDVALHVHRLPGSLAGEVGREGTSVRGRMRTGQTRRDVDVGGSVGIQRGEAVRGDEGGVGVLLLLLVVLEGLAEHRVVLQAGRGGRVQLRVGHAWFHLEHWVELGCTIRL